MRRLLLLAVVAFLSFGPSGVQALELAERWSQLKATILSPSSGGSPEAKKEFANQFKVFDEGYETQGY